MVQVIQTISPLEKLQQIRKNFVPPENCRRGTAFKPEPDSVIISTALKSGTTLTQQICHGLRSYGDMSFDEINLAVPVIDSALEDGYQKLLQKQQFEPQMYKTHFWYPDCPKGAAKYIVVVRKPSDVALSMYYYLENWQFPKGEISIKDFVELMWLKDRPPQSYTERASTLHHIASWYPHRFDSNVLWLHYEDFREDLRECVRLIAQFLDTGADDVELQELITKQSTLSFMKKHATKFDEHPIKLGRNEALGLPKYAGLIGNTGKVRTGKVNSSKDNVPQSTIDKIDKAWCDIMAPVSGHKTYEDFRNGINKELNRKFA